MVKKEEMLIFKMRQQGEAPASAPTKEEQAAIQQIQQTIPKSLEPVEAPNFSPPPPSDMAEMEKPGKKGSYKEELRQQAIGQFCEWHPWRPAFAVCYTCHKAYCYEDVSEYNDRYYCLEDIDAATVGEGPQQTFGYNKLSMVAASAFMLSILSYIYFQNGLLVFVGQTALRAGIPAFLIANFVSTFNIEYFSLILGFILSIVQFIAGVLVFAQSKRGFWLGIFSGAISFVLFSYAYVVEYQFYGFVMCAFAIIGIVMLGYSRRPEPGEAKKQSQVPAVEPQHVGWTNPKAF